MSLGISVHRDLDELVSVFEAEFSAILLQTRSGLVVLSTGPVSLAMYDRFVWKNASLPAASFGNIQFVSADESYPLADHTLPSNRSVLTDRFLSPLSIDSSRLHSFDMGASNPAEECRRMDTFLDSKGPARLFVGEIDAFGRVGRVQPGTPYSSRSHVACVPDTADTPDPLFGRPNRTPCAMTVGLQEFTRADLCLVSAMGESAGTTIRKSLSGLVSENLPCGVLRFARVSRLLLDASAGRAIGDDLLRRYAVDMHAAVPGDQPPPFFAS